MAIVADYRQALATIRIVRKVLLLGYFGAGNFGDDALLCDWFARHSTFLAKHGLRVDVVGHSEFLTNSFTEHKLASSRVDLVLTRQEALKIKLDNYCSLIIPGGSLLQDVTSLRSLMYYLLIIHRFTRARRHVYMLHQGFGPFRTLVARMLTPFVLSKCRFLTCRDEDSLIWARKSGNLRYHQELHASADPILSGKLSLDLTTIAAWDLPNEYVLTLPRPTGDIPSPGDPTGEPAALAKLIHTTRRATGMPVFLLPLHTKYDTQFAHETAALAPQDCQVLQPLPIGVSTGTAALTAIAQAKLVISYRLHGVISAAAYGVPAFGVAYDPKVESCCEELGLPYCFPATVHEQAAQADVERLWRERDEAVEVMLERKAKLLDKLDAAEQRYIDLWKQDCG